MRELTCSSAQLWIQAPDDLNPDEMRRLDAHVQACSKCAQLQSRSQEMDRLIDHSLNAVTQAASVRLAVRAQLEQQKRSSLAVGLLGRIVSRPVLVAGPLALAAILLATFLPGLFRRGQGPQTASAFWRLVRSNVAYPVAVDPVRPNHLLAGASGQVYESWNAGSSWRPLAPLPPHLVVRDLAVDAAQPNRYVVAVKHSVFVSRDAGHHWRATATSLQGTFNVFLMENPRDPHTFYLGPSILWRSKDDGDTWLPAGRGTVFAPEGIQSLAVEPNGELVTGIWAGGVAISRDGGRTWERRARGLRRNVLDVTVAQDGKLWAGTDRGAFFSASDGLRWHRSSLPRRLLTTSLADGGTYLLAGGNGGLYRSTDGGRHWRLSMRGLPIDPYVYGLVVDPHRPGRVFASLNSDGVFRSDDGGQHWIPVNTDLPLRAPRSAGNRVLFLRGGVLWITDGYGTDPQDLTVERTVRLAALSPDGAAVAYLASTDDGWAVRVLGAGGSLASTVDRGSGAAPVGLLWSPDSSLLAIERAGQVSVSTLARRPDSWSLPSDERLVGWWGGRDLLFWDARSGRMRVRSWTSGAAAGTGPAVLPARPLAAPDGKHVAYVHSGGLYIGTWQAVRRVAPVDPTCGPSSWSDDSVRLLLGCGPLGQERTMTGTLLAEVRWPAVRLWVPGSHADLLLFSRGSLWRWTPGKRPLKIVGNAYPPTN
jgi:photosystem II stability/assembly factor-like uncharacterized protein